MTVEQAQKTVSKQLAEMNEEISLTAFFSILAKQKKLLIGLPLVAAVLAAAVSMVLPDVFKATTRLLPPQQAQSSAAAMLSQMGGMAAAAAGIGGVKNPSDLYVGMLKSRTLADRLIDNFDLKKVYNTDSQERARAILEKNTSISAARDGFITIEVEDKNKKLVAPLTNAYVSELVRMTKVLAVTEAGQRRMFYEQQLAQAKNNLAKVEASVNANLDRNGVISVDTVSRAMLETIGRVRAQVSAKEIQLDSMRAFMTPDNPQYKRVEEEVRSLRAELSKLENGQQPAAGSDVAASAGQQRGFENVKLLRDVKYYQMLYDLLARQYEVARMDEAKDPSVIQVLDAAQEPENKFKPRRALIVLLSACAGLVAAAVCAVVLEARRKLANPRSSGATAAS